MSVKHYTYRAYGLIISSEIPLPELDLYDGKPDIVIKLGTTYAASNPIDAQLDWIEASDNTCTLKMEGIAHYNISGGREIIIEPYKNADWHDIRLFLLGSAMAALFHQRHYLVMHGAGIMVNGKCAIITGESGIGKSTLAAALHDRGYQILSDDICVIQVDPEGKTAPLLYPGVARIKLWPDAAKQLSKDLSSLPKLSPNHEKHGLKTGIPTNPDPAMLWAIFELRLNDSASPAIVELSSTEKLTTILDNAFRYEFLEAQGLKTLHFKQSAAVSRVVDVFRLFRPGTGFEINKLVECLEANWILS